MEENILQEGQIVEVDYNKDLVKEYKNNYIIAEKTVLEVIKLLKWAVFFS